MVNQEDHKGDPILSQVITQEDRILGGIRHLIEDNSELIRVIKRYIIEYLSVHPLDLLTAPLPLINLIDEILEVYLLIWFHLNLLNRRHSHLRRIVGYPRRRHDIL